MHSRKEPNEHTNTHTHIYKRTPIQARNHASEQASEHLNEVSNTCIDERTNKQTNKQTIHALRVQEILRALVLRWQLTEVQKRRGEVRAGPARRIALSPWPLAAGDTADWGRGGQNKEPHTQHTHTDATRIQSCKNMLGRTSRTHRKHIITTFG